MQEYIAPKDTNPSIKASEEFRLSCPSPSEEKPEIDLSREAMSAEPDRDPSVKQTGGATSKSAPPSSPPDLSLPPSLTVPDAMKCAGALMLCGSLAALYFTPFNVVPAAIAVGGILLGAIGDVIEERAHARGERMRQEFLIKAEGASAATEERIASSSNVKIERPEKR